MQIAARLILLTLILAVFSCSNPPQSYTFPQGVASGDPHADGLVFWTRVVPASSIQEIPLTLQIARDTNFLPLTSSQTILAKKEHDYIVQPYVVGLEAYTRYYYRFIAGADTSRLGRTITAPAKDQASKLNFATLACQSYEQGFYGTLKTLIEADKIKEATDQIDLVFQVGDYIYEVVGDDPRNNNHHPTWLTDRFGQPRAIPAFPVGVQRPDDPNEWKSGAWQPYTVEDYRHLYKVYLSNPVMQEARARWPFVVTWDDHEFTDGSYQSYSPAAKKVGKPGFQTVKVAANQAWSEMIPMALDQAETISGVEKMAHDFRPIEVKNQDLGEEIKQGIFQEANNLKAINSLTMYRTLQWGKDIVIMVTDNKSYQLPGYSVLGDQQKAWFKSVLKNSTAKWKLWLNAEPISDVQINYSAMPTLDRKDESVYNDSWAATPEEAQEILRFIKEEAITGVVSLSGDYHIQMAGMAGLEQQAIMPDLTVTSTSAFADFFWLSRRGMSYEDDRLAQIYRFSTVDSLQLPNINTAVLHGVQAAFTFAETNDTNLAAQLVTNPNPWFCYFDCVHNGYFTGKVAPDTLKGEFVNTENARIDYEDIGAPVVSRFKVDLPLWDGKDGPQWTNIQKKGDLFPPF